VEKIAQKVEIAQNVTKPILVQINVLSSPCKTSCQINSGYIRNSQKTAQSKHLPN
jgi:hypothetical protein